MIGQPKISFVENEFRLTGQSKIFLSKFTLDTIIISLSLKFYNIANKFINTSKSYGQKTGGLLLRLIYESNICILDDGIQAIPLDRHDIEISYLNGIIKNKELTAKQIAELSTAYISASDKLKINPSFVDKYLWKIGNQYCNKHNCINCPLGNNCLTKTNKLP